MLGLQAGDGMRVDVDIADGMTLFGEAFAGRLTDDPGADNQYSSHFNLSFAPARSRAERAMCSKDRTETLTNE